MDEITIRMIERLLISAGGITSICLGYLLFIKTHIKPDSHGKLNLTNILSISFSRVGPGVFFAFFGAWILHTSLNQPISVSRNWTGNTHQALFLKVKPDAIRRTEAAIGRIQNLLENVSNESIKIEVLKEISIIEETIAPHQVSSGSVEITGSITKPKSKPSNLNRNYNH